MSFEDLQKLKEKLGIKVYKDILFGPRKGKEVNFKRENKNRPREVSAKKPISSFREVIQVKKNFPRDPRFDSLCGTFDRKRFDKAYRFLSNVKKNDLAKLKKKLKNCNDPKEIKKIQYLTKRLENQLNEESRRNQKEEKEYEEKKEITDALKHGKKPTYKKKCK